MSCNCPVRSRIQTGDMLAWGEAYGEKRFSVLKLIRLFTISEYGHISIAWRREDGLYHVEAVRPFIRIAKIKDDAAFYVLPMSNVLKKPVDMDFFHDKIGLKYSVLDALRAYFGMVALKDDKWQCAELAQEFYETQGIDLRAPSPTPAHIVKAAVNLCDLSIFYVDKKPLPVA